MSDRHAKKIDNLRWTLSGASFNALAAGTQALAWISATTLPETIMRMRGTLLVYVDGAQAPGGQTRIGVGIIKVPEGSGTTVVWSPQTDANAPWVWVSYFTLGYEEMVTDVVDVSGATAYREIIDNKAMRRTRPDEEYQAVVESITTGTALSVNVQLNVRTLIGF